MISTIEGRKTANSKAELYVLKRIKRRSAPGALDLGHNRSDSDTTLVNSLRLRSTTPSPLEFDCAPVRPSASKNFAGSGRDFRNETDTQIQKEQKEVSGFETHEEIEFAVRIRQAVEATKEATDREWESADAATELRHKNEIEELREEHEDENLNFRGEIFNLNEEIFDLKEKYQKDLKKVRKKNGEKMKEARGVFARAISEKNNIEKTLSNITTERDILRDELRAKDKQLDEAFGAAKALQANIIAQTPKGQAEREISSLTGPVPEGRDPSNVLPAELHATTARLQNDLAECQKVRDFYIAKTERYRDIIVEGPGRADLADYEENREEELSVLRKQVQDYKSKLEDERRARTADSEAAWNQLMVIHDSMRRKDLELRAMEASRLAALAANESNIRMMRRPLSDNEIDTAFWEHLRIIEKDFQELQYNVRGHELEKMAKEEELNGFKAKILELELKGPEDNERIRGLEEEIRQANFDYGTAVIERDIARQDQDNREPEVWRLIRDKPLRERDEKIARLEAQLRMREDIERGDNSDRSNRSNREKATQVHVLATPKQEFTPWPSLGWPDAKKADSLETLKQETNPGLLFGNEEATTPGVLSRLLRGSPQSDQSGSIFF